LLAENKLKGTIYVIICILLWALIPVVAKIGQTELNNHQFLFWSSLLSFVVLFLTVAFTGRLGNFKSYTFKDLLWLGFLGLLGTYIYYLFLYLGYAQAIGMEVLVVQYTWPIFIVLLSVPILKERLTLKKTATVILGFIGVSLAVTRGDLSGVELSNLSVIGLVGAGAFCFALFSVYSKRIVSDPLCAVTIYFLVATIASFASMLALSEFAMPARVEVMPILLNGMFVNGFSYVFWLLALRYTDASYLAQFTFITPILSALYLLVFFDEAFYAVYVLSIVLVVGGGVISNINLQGIRSKS